MPGRLLLSSGLVALGVLPVVVVRLAAQGPTLPQTPEVIEKRGRVDFARADGPWTQVVSTNLLLNLRDRLRTLDFSRASLLLAERDILRVDELTTLEIPPPVPGQTRLRIKLDQGSLYFFHRGGSGELEVESPAGVVGLLGTEFHIKVAEGNATVSVLEGEVTVSNRFGTAHVTNLHETVLTRGAAPVATPVLNAENIIQWCLYYPGVLDVNELDLTPEERAALAPSIRAYERGNALRALEEYPPDGEPVSPAGKEFRAALLLAAGRVDECQALLGGPSPDRAAARALSWLIAAVKRHRLPGPFHPTTASEFLAFSYYAQAFHQEYKLESALAAATEAVRLSPQFGFARARLAELAFSFGLSKLAERELGQATNLSPENAQAQALDGFVLAARGRWTAARAAFDQAVRLDSGLGNAWLGRGLCRIHRRDAAGGRRDLEVAAALEPNRSLLRSYLGKAFSQEGDEARAARELGLARELDPNDPTPLLYQAFLEQQMNRINPAVAALEESVLRNENRQVYRSRFLLDEDRSVRESGLASLYRNAGLQEVSLREASRSVNRDYANDAAHLFLAESYDALRDPRRVNLRYETAWFSERLIANLMAPAEGGNLSQQISQYEYSRFFAVPGLSLQSAVEYLSTGEWHVQATQAGNSSQSAYALDVDYLHQPGHAPNAGFDRVEWYTQFKQQVTPADAVFLQTKYMDFKGGDILQYYDLADTRQHFEFHETQRPILLAGYQHRWQPGVQTLLLAGWLDDDFRLSEQGHDAYVIAKSASGAIDAVITVNPCYDVEYENLDRNYTAELNQVFENEHQLLVLGGRFVGGDLRTRNQLTILEQSGVPPFAEAPSADFHSVGVLRASGYGYYTHKWERSLLLTAGLSYDFVEYPENFLNTPVSTRQTRTDQLSPKLAASWNALDTLTFRGIWSRTLGGVTFDESIRLEPTQLAGFIQSYRTLISESVVGSVSAPRFETTGVAADWNPYRRGYTGVQFEYLNQQVDRSIGVLDDVQSTGILASQTPESLDYQEYRASFYFNQLLHECWGARLAYQFVHSDLDQRLTAIDPRIYPPARLQKQADLHQVGLQLLYNHPKGWFGRAEALWHGQDYSDSTPDSTDEDLWQFNVFLGYRLRRQRGDILLGILNLSDEDYRLQPLTPYLDLPRQRTLYARVRFKF